MLAHRRIKWHPLDMLYDLQIELFLLALLLMVVAVSGWFFYTVRGKRVFIRVPVRVASVVIVAVSFAVLAFLGWGVIVTRKISAPMYSPGRSHSIRVEDHDEGAVGGETNVDLYSSFGLHKDTVFSSEWKSTEPKDIRWVNDHEVLIQYHAPVQPMTCVGAQDVVVHCQRAPEWIH